ncbi:MAG: hypothetical protein QF675_13575, partial [SAR324 cluster bacterium]|nr:hypothetical protein [SAR324 cluster bacterium]
KPGGLQGDSTSLASYSNKANWLQWSGGGTRKHRGRKGVLEKAPPRIKDWEQTSIRCLSIQCIVTGVARQSRTALAETLRIMHDPVKHLTTEPRHASLLSIDTVE